MPNGEKKKKREYVVLYVEDQKVMEMWEAYIKETCSPNSKGVRSVEAATDLLESGFKPDFVIHDCEVFNEEDDKLASYEAGDLLYSFFLRYKIPVVVLTGDEDRIYQEPYSSSDNLLGVVSKPVDKESIDKAIAIGVEKVTPRSKQ